MVTRPSIFDREAVIRPYRPEDEPEVLALYRTVFGAGAEEKLVERRWRYERNPAGHHRTMVCALEDGSLVASYTAIPLRVGLLGRPTRGALMVDAMTHPSVRGALLGRGGIFARTTEALAQSLTEEGFEFSFGVPQRRHARLGQLVMSYELRDDIGYYSRAIEDTWIKRMRRTLPDPRVERLESFGPDADALWERLSPAYDCSVIRDARYLRWRYDECPRHDYLRFALRGRDGGWDGWMVVSVDGATATLVDALLPPDPSRGASALLYRVMGAAIGRGATEMVGWARPGTPIERLLVAGGFWKETYDGVRFACRLFVDSVDGVALRDRWYFQPGDTDDH
jgi:hypothetical protein